MFLLSGLKNPVEGYRRNSPFTGKIHSGDIVLTTPVLTTPVLTTPEPKPEIKNALKEIVVEEIPQEIKEEPKEKITTEIQESVTTEIQEKITTEDTTELTEKTQKTRKQYTINTTTVKCEHCGKDVSPAIYARWHGDNCRSLLINN